jgi:tryptophan synthase alpha chain
MARIAKRFALLRQQGRKALIPFVTAGDPQPRVTVPLLHTLVDAGADLLELGIPFSDPMADGPVIQQGNERALKNHVNLNIVLEMVTEFRAKDENTPIVLMGYLNPIEVMGYERFAENAARAGVDGLITVDLPPEESELLCKALHDQGLDPIFLLAPTSTAKRIDLIINCARGFVYYVALRGVTGAGNLNVEEVKQKLLAIRRHTALPLGVGFGINSPEAAARVAEFADAVIVGSAVVKRIADLAAYPDKIKPEIAMFIGSLRAAMDKVTRVAAPAAEVRR